MYIWTIGYFPFTMGGPLERPVKCDVPVTGPFDIGAGYQAFVAVSPSGKTFVAESITGAIVGPSLEEVRADVASATVAVMTKAVMTKQIESAKKQVAIVQTLSPKEFWHLLRAD